MGTIGKSDTAKLSKGLVQRITGYGKEWAFMKLDEIAELWTAGEAPSGLKFRFYRVQERASQKLRSSSLHSYEYSSGKSIRAF
jgi:hypothetical protein